VGIAQEKFDCHFVNQLRALTDAPSAARRDAKPAHRARRIARSSSQTMFRVERRHLQRLETQGFARVAASLLLRVPAASLRQRLMRWRRHLLSHD
jgi:hypothetical protein